MKARLDDILANDDVLGVFLVSAEGRVLAGRHAPARDGGPAPEPGPDDLKPLLEAMKGVREADLIFDRLRIYVREAGGDYLVVLMGHFAPAAMVRLDCDVLLPAIEKARGPKGLGRFFKRGKN